MPEYDKDLQIDELTAYCNRLVSRLDTGAKAFALLKKKKRALELELRVMRVVTVVLAIANVYQFII